MRGRVWLADDSAGQLAFAFELLRAEHDVETFTDGALLLERLAQPDVEVPELLLLDWHMPGVSGLEVCRFVRERYTHAALPILVLTGNTRSGDLEDAFAAGANDYVAKPARTVELLTRIRTLLQLVRHEESRRVSQRQRERLLADAQAARHLSENALRELQVVTEAYGETEARLRHVLESSGTGTWELDAASGVLTGDMRFYVLMGLPPGRPLTQAGILEMLHPADREPIARALRSALAGKDGGLYRVEHRTTGVGDAPERWVEGRGQALFGTYGEVLRLVGTVVDISARKAAEAAVLRNVEFEQQLIGIVSHDLRNPLSAILMGAQFLLREDALTGRQLRSLARIQSSAERAQRLISDLLDFTQARLGGGLQVRPEPMDLHALVRQAVDEVQLTHAERDIHVVHEGDGQGHCDADRMTQVLGNLLANALSYSPNDSPVRVFTRGEPSALVLQVHNMGPPIPSELLPRLFEPMQRGHQPLPSRTRSVGLGLYIVDQVVRAHGGEVQVQSGALEGTTFAVRLPRTMPSA